jgi:hypothetical protein
VGSLRPLKVLLAASCTLATRLKARKGADLSRRGGELGFSGWHGRARDFKKKILACRVA